MPNETSPTEDPDTTPEDGTTHPAGQIRLSPARAIGLRASALGALAVGAAITAVPLVTAVHTTSGP
ncbi:hypothetical protein BLA60_27760 [Actinophytocola xinjiangensis]|uniref:Uncharacterized protein n=1 Tax=Actinophytocola xinjiangensis TaxID=485602 RepID=A0A7Z0WJ66_9PSEU|nr:hypothetical protein [Actinophytocola xinjiangensis]OLF07368.1 hypothetical protein BLA60_27760 [Actinophytocola xinjiangensis]